MAFQTGSQVNPALGRTDFTPFLQGAMQGAQAQARGAELIGQGLAGLGQQVASGIEKYYKKEEEKKVKQQGVDFIVKNFGVDEKAAAAGIGAVGAQAFANFLQGEQEKQKLSGLFNQTNAPAAGVAIQGGASFEQLPMDGAAYKTTPIGVQQFIERGFAANIDPNKIASVANAMVNAREAELRAQPKPRDPAEILKLNAEVDKLRAEARRADAQALMAGQPSPTLKLAQEKFDYEKGKDEAKKAAEDANFLDQVAFQKTMLGTTIDNIDQSIKLLKGGAGGTIQGFAPVAAIGAMLPFGGSSKILISKLDSIKSAVKLENIMSMKAMSKTGATGLGTITDREGQDLANNIAKIDPSLPEEEQIANLILIKETLTKLGDIKSKKIAAPEGLEIISIKKLR